MADHWFSLTFFLTGLLSPFLYPFLYSITTVLVSVCGPFSCTNCCPQIRVRSVLLYGYYCPNSLCGPFSCTVISFPNSLCGPFSCSIAVIFVNAAHSHVRVLSLILRGSFSCKSIVIQIHYAVRFHFRVLILIL